MFRTRRQHKFLTGLAWVSVFATLLLAGVLGRAWALPGRVPLGQTIPPPPTPSPTNAVPLEPTATWTPRPTWTSVVTQPPGLPTATPTPVVSLPTATQPPPPTATQVAARVTTTSLPPAPGATMTATPSSPTPTLSALHPTLPSATPALGPIPLAFEVAVVPQVAGPRDAVQFILQVANVGYATVDDVQVAVVFPHDLWLQSVECSRCTIDCPACHGGPVIGQLTIFIGRVPAGDQVIAPVHVQVADDAWPGQTLRADWSLTATGLPAQAVQAAVVLPWAPLPSTGGQ